MVDSGIGLVRANHRDRREGAGPHRSVIEVFAVPVFLIIVAACTPGVTNPPPLVPAGTETRGAICTVSRLECRTETFDPATQQTGCIREPVTFDAHVAYNPNLGTSAAEVRCFGQFCPSADYPPPCVIVAATPVPATTFPTEVWTRLGFGNDRGNTDSIWCNRRERVCTSVPIDPANPGGINICQPLDLTPSPNPGANCFNPVLGPAGLEACGDSAPVEVRDASVLITQHIPDDVVNCPPPMALNNDRTYALSASPLAQVTVSGETSSFSQRGGFARVRRTCYGHSCQVTQLASLRILVADFFVADTTIRNVELRTNRPATIINGAIEEGDLVLDVTGTVGSNPALTRFQIRNEGSVTVSATPTSFNLQGGLTLVTQGPGGQAMTISVSLGSAGPLAPGANCDTVTPKQRRFGFEDAGMWSSSQASLSTVISPRTEGCFAMGVTGAGYMTIQSPVFPSSDAGQVSKLSVDLFVPVSQPNPYWLGALQSYLECPSANLFNAYIGQVELTGLPKGEFSTLSFSLPSNVRSTLVGNWNDCVLRLALNVNQTGQVWVLDKLGFSH